MGYKSNFLTDADLCCNFAMLNKIYIRYETDSDN